MPLIEIYKHYKHKHIAAKRFMKEVPSGGEEDCVRAIKSSHRFCSRASLACFRS